MRQETADSLKSSLKGNKKHGAPLQKIPKEGTKTLELYDLFQANKGKIIHKPISKIYNSVFIRALTDYYGLDIMNLGYGKWVLAGEWVGNNYVDYIAAELNKKGTDS